MHYHQDWNDSTFAFPIQKSVIRLQKQENSLTNEEIHSKVMLYQKKVVPLHKISKNMAKETSLKIIEQNDNVSLYSICFNGNEVSEYEKFLLKFKNNARLNKDFQTIILALSKIIEKGALERFFRNEGKMSDNLCALSIDSRRLRLYCLRISDQILIVGNGGEKTTRTFQEDEILSGYVMDLQKFDELLRQAQKTGTISIENNIITSIDAAIFKI